MSSVSRVVYTRRLNDEQGILRRRACLLSTCGFRWYTLQAVETPIDPSRLVWKNHYRVKSGCEVGLKP